MGWHERGYLPHFDSLEATQFITFRLADSLPQVKLRQLENKLKHLSEASREAKQREQIEKWLDAGMGCNALKHPEMASVMEATLQKYDGGRYRLIAWCIMPNHVHVVIEPKVPLAKIVQSWKSFTGRWALGKNAELGLGVPGGQKTKPGSGTIEEHKTQRGRGSSDCHLWMREYWDRYIRNAEHFHETVHYIHENPVKAGLCREPSEWPWSSARFVKERFVGACTWERR
jgi:REP element-mobilizing transposase RayT